MAEDLNDTYEIVIWPMSQELMDKEGFDENCHLVNDHPFFAEYGSSAFFVRKSWLKEQITEYRIK